MTMENMENKFSVNKALLTKLWCT